MKDGENVRGQGSNQVPVLASSDLVAIVGVADLNRARDFYRGVLGLPVADESPFAIVINSNGTMLRLTAVEKPLPAPYSVLAWNVGDIAATVDELGRRGVVFMRYDRMAQDDRCVWTAPDGTKVAWFLDPDDNNLSVVQFA
ncbi:MAG TPA: VOC family protein [Pseudonocardiaceae bacterium]|jgi:catechol 2,3-dioxygenase-like lactoylglutathione lyase family enzyme|nr:VOC family protein [Pseudonocardiaceae bacterium]